VQLKKASPKVEKGRKARPLNDARMTLRKGNALKGPVRKKKCRGVFAGRPQETSAMGKDTHLRNAAEGGVINKLTGGMHSQTAKSPREPPKGRSESQQCPSNEGAIPGEEYTGRQGGVASYGSINEEKSKTPCHRADE